MPRIRMRFMDLACIWTLEARPEGIRNARRLAAAFAHDAGLTGPLAHDVALAVSEAVTNVVQHAFHPDLADPAPLRLVLAARSTAQDVEFLVSDNGRGLRHRPRGAGVGFGNRVIDAVAVTERKMVGPHGGAAVTMRFPRAKAGAG